MATLSSAFAPGGAAVWGVVSLTVLRARAIGQSVARARPSDWRGEHAGAAARMDE